MDRNRHQTTAASLPAVSTSALTPGYFTKGDATLGSAATVPTADWANGITEEIYGAIVESGQTPSQSNLKQLIAAMGSIGKRRNLIINGNFNIWQRNTTQSAAGYGSADRWRMDNSTSTFVLTREPFTVGQTEVPNNPVYYCRNAVTYVASSTNFVRMQQIIEEVRRLAGKKAILSFYAKSDVNKVISVEFVQSFGTGGSPSAEVNTQGVKKFTLTTSWVKYTAPVTLASITGKTLGTNNDDALIVNFWLNAGTSYNSRTNTIINLSGIVDIAQVQLEEGEKETDFQMRHLDEQYELCNRYYNTLKAFVGTTSTNVFFHKMRKAPTVAGGGAGFTLVDAGIGNSIVCSQTTGAVQTLTLDAEL